RRRTGLARAAVRIARAGDEEVRALRAQAKLSLAVVGRIAQHEAAVGEVDAGRLAAARADAVARRGRTGRAGLFAPAATATAVAEVLGLAALDAVAAEQERDAPGRVAARRGRRPAATATGQAAVGEVTGRL